MPFVITRFPPILGESPHSDWNVPRMLDDITRLLDINVTYHISIHFFILGACVLFFCVLRKMHILYIIFTHIHIYIYIHMYVHSGPVNLYNLSMLLKEGHLIAKK